MYKVHFKDSHRPSILLTIAEMVSVKNKKNFKENRK